MTSGVVELAARHAFPIHFYGFHGNYRGTFLPSPVATTATPLIEQVRESGDAAARLARAKEILAGAHAGMTTLLAKFDLTPPSLSDASSLGDLRLAEARVRKEYYALLDTVLPEYWSIVRRERQPPRRPADAVLSFVNGLLYAKMAGWIHRAGLDPRIGYLHGDERASNPLALDLAEVLKPPVAEAALLTLAASGHERSLLTDVGEGVYLNEKGRKETIRVMEDILATNVDVDAFDRMLDVRRIGELIPIKLHRGVVTSEAVTYPVPACTLSSSTTRILNEGRTSVGSS
jgi:CRISPR-associated protein Cas1